MKFLVCVLGLVVCDHDEEKMYMGLERSIASNECTVCEGGPQYLGADLGIVRRGSL